MPPLIPGFVHRDGAEGKNSGLLYKVIFYANTRRLSKICLIFYQLYIFPLLSSLVRHYKRERGEYSSLGKINKYEYD